jgi:CBS domain-containing protein
MTNEERPMKKVSHLIEGKEGNVWRVAPTDSVLTMLKVLAEKNVGALVVMDGDALVGVISERDYARKVVLKGKNSTETKVSEIMVEDVLYVTPEHSAEQCMNLMTDRHIRHLPVVDHGKVIGMISVGDLVKNTLNEQKQTIEQLESYIRGG